jgi:lycopene beta-cyclase
MSGAMKPSSGYAMSFIQKQIFDLFQNDFIINKNNANPHKKIDLWMDKIFLKVLSADSTMAVDIFIKLGKILNGDEFALFMSGQANMLIRLKIVFKMHKKPFLKALFY